MHVAHNFKPYLMSVHFFGAYARERLNVSGDAFFDPVVIFRDGRKCEMDHFVGEHPVLLELRGGGGLAEMDADDPTVFSAESATAVYTLTIGGNDVESYVGNRIALVIGCYGFGGVADPGEQNIVGDGQIVAFNTHVDA